MIPGLFGLIVGVLASERDLGHRLGPRPQPDRAHTQGVGEAQPLAREHDDHDGRVIPRRELTRRSRKRTQDRLERGVADHRPW
jgi:hypothetical protein